MIDFLISLPLSLAFVAIPAWVAMIALGSMGLPVGFLAVWGIMIAAYIVIGFGVRGGIVSARD